MKKQEILRKIKLFLFDMDGTLYIGDRLFDFTPRLLDTIKRNGGRYMFLTNNSSKSVNDFTNSIIFHMFQAFSTNNILCLVRKTGNKIMPD